MSAAYPVTTATLDRIKEHHPQGGPLKESHTFVSVVACAPLAEQIGHEGGIAKVGAVLLARLIAELQARCKHLEQSLELAHVRLNALEIAARNSGTPVHQAKVEKRG